MSTYNIAIDGPAGAGKSTIARAVAAKLGFIYVDTGAMYRGIAVYLLDHQIDCASEEAVSAVCGQIRLSIRYQEGSQHIFLGEEDITGRLRTEEVGNTASLTSKYPAVRAHLLSLQRDLAAANHVIMDGRDIGTTILPHAQLKLYLTADSAVRARRRCLELQEKGTPRPFEEVKADIEKRDDQDMHREVSPLTRAEDAVLLDSSSMTITEVIDTILELCQQKGIHA